MVLVPEGPWSHGASRGPWSMVPVEVLGPMQKVLGPMVLVPEGPWCRGVSTRTSLVPWCQYQKVLGPMVPLPRRFLVPWCQYQKVLGPMVPIPKHRIM